MRERERKRDREGEGEKAYYLLSFKSFFNFCGMSQSPDAAF